MDWRKSSINLQVQWLIIFFLMGAWEGESVGKDVDDKTK